MELDYIKQGDCMELMKELPDNSIDCIVTSPPYNKGFWSSNRNVNNFSFFKTKSRRITYGAFDDNLLPEEYEQKQRDFLAECLRVIKSTGSIFYNHIDILNKHQTIHPIWVYDFPLKQIIIWNRKNTPKLDKSYFYPITEYVFWIQKDKNARTYFDRKNAIFNKSIWEINPDKKNEFPAPFPLELPTNCILSTTRVGDVVLDPFMGSGTTMIAAIKTNRHYIGFEIDNNYYNMANKRIKENRG